MQQVLYRMFIRFTVLLLIFFLVYFGLKYNFRLSISKKNIITSKSHLPKVTRVLYLFLCETQAEINAYATAFPSITADVMFFCWRGNCNNTNFIQLQTFYVTPWSGSAFVQLTSEVNYIKIQPRVMIINEPELNLTTKSTWTTARNLLLERALIEEQRQGWKWSYFNFGDGDIQVDCPLVQKLVNTNKTDGDEIVFADYFRSLINKTNKNNQCFVLIDVFLLSASPAIGVIDGMLISSIYDGLLTQIVYHVDAMFNAFHRDAIPLILPYCSRYDHRSWWTSQAILIYRSLCLYGHVIQFNGARITRQKHRKYPHNGNPWSMDNDMNLVPSSLIPLQVYMKQSRLISPLVLRHYRGWSFEITSEECRQNHTFLHPQTCKVSQEENKTIFQSSNNITSYFDFNLKFKN